jgi:hypothetical protein
MMNHGWCSREYIKNPKADLQDTYNRYLAFLEMAVYPEKGRIVPTYDVDFIWHTNQLDGPKYRYVFLVIELL